MNASPMGASKIALPPLEEEEEEEEAVHLPPVRPLLMRVILIQTMHATNYVTTVAAAAAEAPRLAHAQAVLKARPAIARIQ